MPKTNVLDQDEWKRDQMTRAGCFVAQQDGQVSIVAPSGHEWRGHGQERLFPSLLAAWLHFKAERANWEEIDAAAEPPPLRIAKAPPKKAKQSTATCRWCDQAATLLCDGTKGSPLIVKDGKRAAAPTCDAPMCEKHAKTIARGLACSRGCKGGGCHPFTIDYCPDCQTREALKG